MLIPEFLYRLSQRDEQVTWLDPRLLASSLSQAAVGPALNLFTVPPGNVLVLSSVVGRGVAGGAQTMSELVLEVNTPQQTEPLVTLTGQVFDPAVSTARFITWSGQLIIPAEWIIRIVGTFNAAVAANTIRGSVAGILIPVANVGRV